MVPKVGMTIRVCTVRGSLIGLLMVGELGIINAVHFNGDFEVSFSGRKNLNLIWKDEIDLFTQMDPIDALLREVL